jgi:anaerobic glycerol-3-phosphate dehydrogenase
VGANAGRAPRPRLLAAPSLRLPTLPPPQTRARPQEWLQKNIHSRGSLDASGDDLMRAVTGAPLQPAVFLRHLRTKYSSLYKL